MSHVSPLAPPDIVCVVMIAAEALAGWRWRLVPAGLLAGAALGVVARWWMRLLTDDPEFTWSGTLFIVGAFTVFGFGQGLALATRRSVSRRWPATTTRCLGALTSLPLFLGAGMVMLPTFALGALAWWRRRWRLKVRVALGVIAGLLAGIVAATGGPPESGREVAGLGLFAGTYALLIVAFGATVASHERTTATVQTEQMEVLS